VEPSRNKSGIAGLLAFGLLAALYALSSAEKIDLFYGGVDLGRHLKNGELLLSPVAPGGTVSKLLHTNFYSYATPEFEFINHHWLSGVVFFLARMFGGFAGLNAFYILLGGLTFLLFWRMAEESAGWEFASALALLLMPILRARASVRPECFTLLFCGIFLWLLWNYNAGSLSWRALLALPALQVLWVNLHIGFVFGPVFIVAFLFGDLLARPPKGQVFSTGNIWASDFYKEKAFRFKQWLKILALTVAATLVNPSGIYGAAYPLAIWSNYGLEMRENHSILFLENHGYSGEYLLIKLTLLVLYLSFIPVALRARRFPMALFLMAVLIGAMAFLAVRNQPLLAMFSLACIGVNAGLSGVRGFCARRKAIAVALFLAALVAGSYYNGRKLAQAKEKIGLGLRPGATAAADFLRANNLAGPALNDLNSGGYLTYYFFPRYRIYVDSRPEAFPAIFLREKYMEPLTNEDRWAALLDEYQFNMIFFSSASTWENAFASRRARDPNWAPVFAQDSVVILVRRTLANQSFIERHEIPRERLFRKK